MDAAEYAERSRRVAAAFIAAYPAYVRSRMSELGAGGAAVDEAVVNGRDALAAEFEQWQAAGPQRQRRSPLEMFREAMAVPTAAALAVGVWPRDRDGLQEQALPGDLLDLAPASSRELGDEAWEAHVAWGVARAEALAGMVPRPAAQPRASGARVALVGTDLMDRTRIADVAAAAGCELVVWRNPGAVDAGIADGLPAIAFVDLSHPAANEAISRLAGAGVRTIAFGPHVDDLAMAAAGALGASDVLSRARFFARLASLFPSAV